MTSNSKSNLSLTVVFYIPLISEQHNEKIKALEMTGQISCPRSFKLNI